MNTEPLSRIAIAVKGAGEMATGVACRLYGANFRNIYMMDIPHPVAVRRRVSFCEAILDGTAQVEGIRADYAASADQIQGLWADKVIPILADPQWKAMAAVPPHVVIDAVIAKKNLGTALSDAPLVIGLGPGFTAGKDVHVAVETNRGHNLGRILLEGCPEPNTGVPGNIGGFTSERVLRAPCDGRFTSPLDIGTMVRKGDVVGRVDDSPVYTQIDGVVRGLIRPGTRVTTGLKIGDVDPRGIPAYCSTVSEKARAIGGSVLEAVLRTYNL